MSGLPILKSEHPLPSTKQRMKAFLAAVSQLGTIKAAARMVGIEEHTASRWIAKYPQFKEKFDQARLHARQYVVKDAIEENFYQRAVAGKEDGQSGIIGMFVMKSIDSSYRDNAQVSVTAHGPVAIQFNLTPAPEQAKQIDQADPQAE